MSNSSDSRLYFEGVLDKAGKRFFEGFRKRWFTLDGQYLTYYKAPEKTEENCLGTIDFSQVKAVNPSKVTNNGFQITTKNRTYTFSAPSSDLQTEWISLLRQAMQLESFVRCNSRLR
ncbi:PREDICTED: arf-GAP with dual PH domain-containing protein 1-like [Acropora digitifera]|uniref:arf-GAP with dual PH domain-containing protein 1-like n=1 Tax=Acropora digitifera TaxID=70779 RepID=UPI00077ACD73|nr:PREDICTED: arf-GAP with dual PH domain-containing protein 1-like [Acropora digitifera]